MSKVTSKLQVTIPKAVAERHGIRPGDEIDWRSAGDTIRILTDVTRRPDTVEHRLEVFDRASERQAERNPRRSRMPASSRGWTREELYERGRAD
jgi:AbrB family looped-hinge helix DNA binding protein